MKNAQKGFTLIELLVVVSIIGMLSSIVLASLRDARSKATTAAGLQFSSSLYHTLGADALGIWMFNEASGSALDGSGNSLDLPYSGGGSGRINDTPTGQGNAGNGVGGNRFQKTTFASPVSLQQPQYTVSMWVKPTVSLTGSPATLIKVAGSQDRIIQINATNGGLDVGAINATGLGHFSYVLVTSTWQHIAYSWSNNQVRLYINGSSAGAPVSNIPLYGQPQIIAPINDITLNCYSAGNACFTGYIDDVAIYRESVTASGIWNIYAAGAAEHGVAVK